MARRTPSRLRDDHSDRVHFDKELRHLDPRNAEAWRAWLAQHQLNSMDIACPSVLTYWEPTRRKLASVTVELLTKDNAGAFRSKKTITFSYSLLPFPGAYRVEVQMAPPASRAPNIDETDAMF